MQTRGTKRRLMVLTRHLVAPGAAGAVESFAGKVVVVTGAGGGIGSKIALGFARAGADLALCDIRAEELAETERACRRVGASRVECRVIDVSNEGEVQAFCEALDEVDCLVNTVGIVDCFGSVEELALSEWERVMQINVTSSFLTAKYCTPLMRSRGGGAIINISSVSGLANQRKAMVYSVSKAALISLTKSEAIDLAPYKIRANAVLPGSVDTPLLDTVARIEGERNTRTAQEQRDYWAADYPSERFTQPEEIAQLCLFLCSERASNITGSNYVIDGGLTALLPERT